MPEPLKLHDDSLMPFGKHKGQRLGEVPDSYLRWLATQEWVYQRYPDLAKYAKQVLEND